MPTTIPSTPHLILPFTKGVLSTNLFLRWGNRDVTQLERARAWPFSHSSSTPGKLWSKANNSEHIIDVDTHDSLKFRKSCYFKWVHYRRTENLLNNTPKLNLLILTLFSLSHTAPKDMDASARQVTKQSFPTLRRKWGFKCIQINCSATYPEKMVNQMNS